MRTISRVRAATGAPPEDPFIVAKAGHLTALLVGLPNVGKSYLSHRLGGDGASIAAYPFSTTIPAVHLASLDNLRIQIVDLPPLDEGAVEGLPYGEKLRRMLGLADVLCVVLDASGDVELQELVLSEELSSLGVELQAESVLVLGNRASETADPDAPVPDTVLAGTRAPLRSEGDFHGVLARIAAAGGYLSAFVKPGSVDEGGGPAVGGTRRHSQGPGALRPPGARPEADRRPGMGCICQAAGPEGVRRALAGRRRRGGAAGAMTSRCRVTQLNLRQATAGDRERLCRIQSEAMRPYVNPSKVSFICCGLHAAARHCRSGTCCEWCA